MHTLCKEAVQHCRLYLAGRSAILKVADEDAIGSASRSAGAYMQNLGKRSSDSKT